MKKNIIIAVLALAALGTSTLQAAKSEKRGVSENAFNLEEEIAVLRPGVSWFYNWANTPNNNVASSVGSEFIFMPMCWNAGYNADNIRNYCKAHPEVKYLLGFNEPNFKAQANMTPAQAAAAWPQVKALADELGLKLVGPAVNFSPDGDENNPYTWYANFVALVGKDAFDYIAIHNYSGGTSGMKGMVDQFYETYGKQIWITEFCNWPSGVTVTQETQISSMVEQLEYLEKSDRVFRYAWFKAKGSTTSSPAYGLIVPKNGTGPRELSEQGKVYVYMTDFDSSVYHSTDEVVPATEYINSQSLVLGSTSDATNTKPIEITKFNSGAYADYQFDIPTAGTYTLTMRVSGMGEPTRFDPTIGIYSVDADGNVLSTLSAAKQFALPNDNATYNDVTFSLNLQAGKQRIRIKDDGPYSPSGIHISCLSFKQLGSVGIIATQLAVCAVIGNRLIFSADVTSAEVYDINGRLMAKSAVSESLDISALAGGVYVVRATTQNGEQTTTKIVK